MVDGFSLFFVFLNLPERAGGKVLRFQKVEWIESNEEM